MPCKTRHSSSVQYGAVCGHDHTAARSDSKTDRSSSACWNRTRSAGNAWVCRDRASAEEHSAGKNRMQQDKEIRRGRESIAASAKSSSSKSSAHDFGTMEVVNRSWMSRNTCSNWVSLAPSIAWLYKPCRGFSQCASNRVLPTRRRPNTTSNPPAVAAALQFLQLGSAVGEGQFHEQNISDNMMSVKHYV